MCPHTTLLWWQLEAWEKEAQLYAKYFANLNPVLDGGVGVNFPPPPFPPPHHFSLLAKHAVRISLKKKGRIPRLTKKNSLKKKGRVSRLEVRLVTVYKCCFVQF
jgi:hypothetical protein